MTSPTLCRGEAVGGMVDSVVNDEYNEPVQLQRITSRCFCQIYYVNYGTEAENIDKDSVPPVIPVVRMHFNCVYELLCFPFYSCCMSMHFCLHSDLP